MDTIERKKKIEELVGGTLMHVNADVQHAESNFRMLRASSSDNNVDWFLSRIIEQAIVAAASLQVMCRKLDEQGLTTAELSEEVDTYQQARDAHQKAQEEIAKARRFLGVEYGDPSDPGQVG